jgi:hypothetical protein
MCIKTGCWWWWRALSRSEWQLGPSSRHSVLISLGHTTPKLPVVKIRVMFNPRVLQVFQAFSQCRSILGLQVQERMNEPFCFVGDLRVICFHRPLDPAIPHVRFIIAPYLATIGQVNLISEERLPATCEDEVSNTAQGPLP